VVCKTLLRLSLTLLAIAWLAGQAFAGEISYRRDVWPILKRHCRGCHSGGDPQGGLKLDDHAALHKGGDSGPLLVAGKPDESLLMDMISGEEPEMPPEQAPLSATKVETLRRWIAAGAKVDSVPAPDALKVVIPEAYTFAPAITAVALDRDGSRAAAACRSEVVLVHVDSLAPPQRLPTECGLISHVEFSPDGELLAVAGGSPARYGEVRFYKAGSGKLVSTRRIGHDTLFRGNFAPGGTAIALGGADGAVHIVPVDPQADVRSFDLHSDWVLDAAYTPDGKMLVTGGRDNATKVASVETGELLRSVDSSPEMITSVAANEQFGFSAGKAQRLTAYDFKIALQSIQVTGAGNGARPVTRRNQYTKSLEAQPGEVLDIATSGDRSTIAVVGRSGEARVYKTANRRRTALIRDLPAPIYSAALDHGATRLAVGSKDGHLQVYELPEGKQLKSLIPVPVATSVASESLPK